MATEIKTVFPTFSSKLVTELRRSAVQLAVEEGQYIENIEWDEQHAFVLSGSIKMLENIRGQYFLLYRVKSGESLFLPPARNEKRSFKRFAEVETELITIPIELSRKWVCEYPEWKKFLDECHASTMDKLLDTLWHSGDCLENRILAYLKDLADTHRSKQLRITHAEIAEEIGSVREVVSRSLKKLEHHGKVQLKRGRILLS